MRRRRASMIAPLSLLACTATASAECSWVLWETRGCWTREASTDPH